MDTVKNYYYCLGLGVHNIVTDVVFWAAILWTQHHFRSDRLWQFAFAVSCWICPSMSQKTKQTQGGKKKTFSLHNWNERDERKRSRWNRRSSATMKSHAFHTNTMTVWFCIKEPPGPWNFCWNSVVSTRCCRGRSWSKHLLRAISNNQRPYPKNAVDIFMDYSCFLTTKTPRYCCHLELIVKWHHFSENSQDEVQNPFGVYMTKPKCFSWRSAVTYQDLRSGLMTPTSRTFCFPARLFFTNCGW